MPELLANENTQTRLYTRIDLVFFVALCTLEVHTVSESISDYFFMGVRLVKNNSF